MGLGCRAAIFVALLVSHGLMDQLVLSDKIILVSIVIVASLSFSSCNRRIHDLPVSLVLL